MRHRTSGCIRLVARSIVVRSGADHADFAKEEAGDTCGCIQQDGKKGGCEGGRVGIFARRGSKMLGWWVRGLGRPTPFFDDRTKAPCAVPRVVTPSERAAL